MIVLSLQFQVTPKQLHVLLYFYSQRFGETQQTLNELNDMPFPTDRVIEKLKEKGLVNSKNRISSRGIEIAKMVSQQIKVLHEFCEIAESANAM